MGVMATADRIARHFAALIFAIIANEAALLPLNDGSGAAFEEAVASCACELASARPGGSPLVAVVFASSSSSAGPLPLSPLLSRLQSRSDSALALLGDTKGRGQPSEYREGRNMSHAIFWATRKVPFSKLVERAAKDARWSPTATHLVLLEASMDSKDGSVPKIFRETWRHGVGDVAIVVSTASDDARVPRLAVLTHHPYAGGRDCGGEPGRVEVSAVWREGRFEVGSAKEIFPRKFLDLHGCTLRISTINYPPISIPKGTEQQDDVVESIDGLHGYILEETSRRLNFTTEIVVFHPSRYQKSSNPYKGIFDRLLEDRTDLVLGEFVLTPDRHEICGEGFFHQWACMTFAVPVGEPERFLLWVTGRLATPPALAALLFCLLLSCFAAWTVANFRPDPGRFAREARSAVSDSLAAFAGVSLRRPPVALSSRALFPAICMGGLVATTAIRAHLVSLLSTPEGPPWAPSDISELSSSRIRVGGPISYAYLAKGMVNEAMKEMLSRYEQLDEEGEVMHLGDVAVAGMEHNLKYRLSNRTGMRLLKECPLPLPTALFLRKGSPIRSGFHELGKGLTSGGFIAKWMSDLTRKTAGGSEESVVGEAKISMFTLKGSFAFYGVGMLLSSVVFAMEVIFSDFRSKMKKNETRSCVQV